MWCPHEPSKGIVWRKADKKIYMYYSKTTINSLNIKTLSFQLKHIQTSEVTEINNLNLKLNLIQFFNRIITWEGAT